MDWWICRWCLDIHLLLCLGQEHRPWRHGAQGYNALWAHDWLKPVFTLISHHLHQDLSLNKKSPPKLGSSSKKVSVLCIIKIPLFKGSIFDSSLGWARQHVGSCSLGNVSNWHLWLVLQMCSEKILFFPTKLRLACVWLPAYAMTDDAWEYGAIFSGSFWLHTCRKRLASLKLLQTLWMNEQMISPYYYNFFTLILSASKIFVWYSSVSNELGATLLDSKWIFFINFCQFFALTLCAAQPKNQISWTLSKVKILRKASSQEFVKKIAHNTM